MEISWICADGKMKHVGVPLDTIAAARCGPRNSWKKMKKRMRKSWKSKTVTTVDQSSID
jgi:hypothetical protein